MRLQVSEKILLLDSECRELRLAAAQADDKAEVLSREKSQLVALADELRADVAAKMSLLDEFEDRFNRQYRCVVCSPEHTSSRDTLHPTLSGNPLGSTTVF